MMAASIQEMSASTFAGEVKDPKSARGGTIGVMPAAFGHKLRVHKRDRSIVKRQKQYFHQGFPDSKVGDPDAFINLFIVARVSIILRNPLFLSVCSAQIKTPFGQSG